jgi:hypothetical protein
MIKWFLFEIGRKANEESRGEQLGVDCLLGNGRFLHT